MNRMCFGHFFEVGKTMYYRCLGNGEVVALPDRLVQHIQAGGGPEILCLVCNREIEGTTAEVEKIKVKLYLGDGSGIGYVKVKLPIGEAGK